MQITRIQAYNLGYEYAQKYGQDVGEIIGIREACEAVLGQRYDLIPDDLRNRWLYGFRAGWLEKDK